MGFAKNNNESISQTWLGHENGATYNNKYLKKPNVNSSMLVNQIHALTLHGKKLGSTKTKQHRTK